MNLKQKLSIVTLVVFITTAVFGVMAITPLHYHEPGCPFMIGEQSICPMGLLEHIRAWQSTFTVLIPYIFLLIMILCLILILWSFTHPPNLSFLVGQKTKQTSSHNLLYQELYSGGILNPKAP